MNDMRKLMEGIEAVIDGGVQGEDLGESKKITAAQVSKLAAKIAVRTEPALFKGMDALGVFPRKGSEGVLGSYLQPVIVAIAKNRGLEVDSSSLRAAKTLTKAMLSALSKGGEAEEQIDPSVLKELFLLEDDDEDGSGMVLSRPITESNKYDGKILGKNCRLQYARGFYKLDELHQKGKRKLRTCELAITPFLQTESALLTTNILNHAKVKPTDSYDAMKKKIKASVEEGYELLLKSPKWMEYAEKNKKWFGKEDWWEKNISALQVEPEGVDPVEVIAKDFIMRSQWREFSAYSPDSDFSSHDPSFTLICQKSPGAARKLYKVLKADPGALKNVSWSKLSGWLGKNKVGFDTRFSTWS